MVPRNTYALLIGGNEQQHVDATMQFRNYLTDEAKFNPERIWVYVDGDHYSVLDKVEHFFQEAKSKAPNQPAVIIYNGHGNKGTFSPSASGQNSQIPYQKLGQLCNREASVLFINNSCHSGSAISIFEDLEILPTKGSVVASSDAQEVSMGSHFQYLLLDAMRNKRPFAKEEIKCYRNLFEYSRSGITRLMFVYEKLLIERREELNPERIHGTLILHIQHPQRSGLSLDHLL